MPDRLPSSSRSEVLQARSPRPEDASRPPAHPTVADLALAAGVSVTTATRALRGSPLVREETRSRILKTARDIDFAPNRMARALSLQSSLFVGMVVPDASDVFYARLFKGAKEVLEDAGYPVLLMDSGWEAEKESIAIETLLGHRVAGILLATSGGYEPARVPVVFLNHAVHGAGQGHVSLANEHGVSLLVEHLLTHGHRRIAYIGGPRNDSAALERRESFQSALARVWHAVPPEYLHYSDSRWSEESGERAGNELITLDPPPTAILAASDRLAVGAMRALRTGGKRIPDDIALVCFDDPLSSDMLEPPLTVVAHDALRLGADAANLMLEQLAGHTQRREIRIPIELIIRRSCGCNR